MGFNDRFDDEEEGYYYEGPEEIPSKEEIKAAVQIILFLEHEMDIEVRRLRVRVRDGAVFIQGSVSSREQRNAIERIIPTRPGVRSLDTSISIDETL